MSAREPPADPVVDDVPTDWRDADAIPWRPTRGGWVVLGEREAVIISDTTMEVRQ